MCTILSMQKSVGAAVFVRIAKSQLVTDRVFLQESERMAQPDVVVCPGLQAWAIKVRAEHDEKIVGRPAFGFGRRKTTWRRLLARRQAPSEHQRDKHHLCAW